MMGVRGVVPGPSLTMFCETMCGKLFCVFFLSFFFQQHSNEGLRHKKHKNTAQNTRIELRNQCFQFPHIQSRSEGPGHGWHLILRQTAQGCQAQDVEELANRSLFRNQDVLQMERQRNDFVCHHHPADVSRPSRANRVKLEETAGQGKKTRISCTCRARRAPKEAWTETKKQPRGIAAV